MLMLPSGCIWFVATPAARQAVRPALVNIIYIVARTPRTAPNPPGCPPGPLRGYGVGRRRPADRLAGGVGLAEATGAADASAGVILGSPMMTASAGTGAG
jgi:hypothetical protein